jgi:hypothetical protein
VLGVSVTDLAVIIDATAERAGKAPSDAALVALAEAELRRAGVDDARQGLIDAVAASCGAGETVEGVLVAQRRAAVSQGLWDHGAAPWALLEV